MKTRILLTVLFALNISFAFAQSSTIVNVLVKGQVIDSLTNETIPYATIKIAAKENPKTMLKAVASDDNGNFKVTMNKKGDYILSVEYIGKNTLNLPLAIGDAKTVDMGKVSVSDNSLALSEVVVSAQKPLVKVDLDKIVYSMEDDPEAQTNNVLDMLKKVPMVTVDGEENIQLKGTSNFKIYLNGKPSNMITNNPKEVLRGMPANTVKDIQVITDPGAKYDAEGVAGIINIITQKNTTTGGYTATINGRVDDMGGYGIGPYLMLKYGKIGFTGSYNYYNWKRPEGAYTSYLEDLTGTVSGNNNKYLTQNGTSKNNGDGQYGSGEISYEIDTLNLINIGFNRHYGSGNSKSDWLNEMLDINNDMRYRYDQLGNSKNTYGGTDLNADYQRTFKKKDQLLTASYKLSMNPNDSKSNTDIQNVQGGLPAYIVTNRQYTDADMKEHTFQVDFVTPFGKIHNLETGAKYIIRINESNSGKDILSGGNWIGEHFDTDKFKHEQDILAAYAGYSAKFKKWGIKTGLRYEATWLDAKFPINNQMSFKTDYSNLVPSATLTYQLKPAQNIRFGYNMRISRPGIWQLNPYQNTSNPNFITVGNPELDAVKTHSLSANYGYFSPKVNLNMNMSYDFENNGIENITSREDGINTTTYGNIGKRKNLRMNAYVNWSVTDKLRLYSNMSGGYIDIKSNKDFDPNRPNEKRSNNGFSGQFFGGGQYSLPKAFRVYANAGVFSPHISLENKGSSFSFHSFSVSKGFMQERLTFRAFAQNPFKKDRDFKNRSTTPEFYSESISTGRMRSFGISFSFRFGELKSQIKKTQRSINNDDAMSGGQGDQSQGGQGGGTPQ